MNVHHSTRTVNWLRSKFIMFGKYNGPHMDVFQSRAWHTCKTPHMCEVVSTDILLLASKVCTHKHVYIHIAMCTHERDLYINQACIGLQVCAWFKYVENRQKCVIRDFDITSRYRNAMEFK